MSEKEILGDCKERVALDLARRIHLDTTPVGDVTPKKDEAYWLRLYGRCLKAVNGHRVTGIELD